MAIPFSLFQCWDNAAMYVLVKNRLSRKDTTYNATRKMRAEVFPPLYRVRTWSYHSRKKKEKKRKKRKKNKENAADVDGEAWERVWMETGSQTLWSKLGLGRSHD